MDKLFLELIQVAIGTRESLSRVPSAEEWKEIFATSVNQKLVAVALVGVQKLMDGEHSTITGSLPTMLRMKWLGYAAKIAQCNKEVTASCLALCKQYNQDGFDCCVLKGQGNLEYYPKYLQVFRTPGDIDVWCRKRLGINDNPLKDGNFSEVIEYVNLQWLAAGKKEHEPSYLHIDAPEINGIPVEVHLRPSFMNNPFRNKKLQRWFNDNRNWVVTGRQGIHIPSLSFNIIFQLSHIQKHLFDEGIGLRQLMDYYMVLQAYSHETGPIGNAYIESILEQLHMQKLTGAMMWSLAQAFEDIPLSGNEHDWREKWPWMLCKPDKKEGEFLLSEILLAGDFGKSDPRLEELNDKPKTTRYQMKRAWRRFKRNLHFLSSYPSETLCEPFTRLYHLFWRKFELWK